MLSVCSCCLFRSHFLSPTLSTLSLRMGLFSFQTPVSATDSQQGKADSNETGRWNQGNQSIFTDKWWELKYVMDPYSCSIYQRKAVSVPMKPLAGVCTSSPSKTWWMPLNPAKVKFTAMKHPRTEHEAKEINLRFLTTLLTTVFTDPSILNLCSDVGWTWNRHEENESNSLLMPAWGGLVLHLYTDGGKGKIT